MNNYITKDEFRKAINEVKADIKDIKDNHLASIYSKVNDLKWFVVGVGCVLGIVLALLQVFG